MRINLCIVTSFEQDEFFQWTIALRRFTKFVVSSVVMNKDTLALYDNKSKYWDPIRFADVVFVYCVRHDLNWKWFNLPFEVKKFMRPESKMICQFDLEFLWMFHENHYPWKDIDPWTKEKTPDGFFKETGVMEIADAYIIFFNSQLRKYTSKPVYKINLPQLVRYQLFTMDMLSKDVLNKSKRVAIIHHSVKSAQVTHTIDNVIMKLETSRPITLFTCRDTNSMEKLSLIENLPLRGESQVYGLISRDSYLEFLESCYVAIDDNDGYYGWSRFAMECALANVPCIGSTQAVKEFFPLLYTKHKDYKKQRKLLKRLYEDSDFWLKVVTEGKRLALEKLDTDYLSTKFFEMANEIFKKKIKKRKYKPRRRPKFKSKHVKSEPKRIKVSTTSEYKENVS
jgi:hypothetical protein